MSGTKNVDGVELLDYRKLYSEADAEAIKRYGMALRELQVNRNMAEGDADESYNQTKKALETGFKNNVKALKREKSLSEQVAQINYEKLMKYLPEQLKAAGLYGVGTSKDSYIRATNDLNNTIALITKNYLDGYGDAESRMSAGLSEAGKARSAALSAAAQDYNNSLLSLESNYNAGKATRTAQLIQQNADDWQRAYLQDRDIANDAYQKELLDLKKKEQERTEIEEKISAFTEMLDKAEFVSADAITAAYDDIKEIVPSWQRSLIDAKVESAKQLYKTFDDGNAKEASAYAAPNVEFVKNSVGSYEENDTFHVKIGDEKYKLDAEYIDDDAGVVGYAEGLDRKSFFIYDDKLYFKTIDGEVVRIKKGKKDYDTIYKEASKNAPKE